MLEHQSLYILFRQRLVQAVGAKKYHVVLRRAELDHARIDQKVAALADIAYERFLLAVGLDLLLRDVSGVALLLKQQAEVMVARDPFEPPVMQVVDSAVSRGYPICLAAADDYRNGRRAAAELSSTLVGDRGDLIIRRRDKLLEYLTHIVDLAHLIVAVIYKLRAHAACDLAALHAAHAVAYYREHAGVLHGLAVGIGSKQEKVLLILSVADYALCRDGDSLGFIRLVRFIGSFLFAAAPVYYSGGDQDKSDCGQYDTGEAHSAQLCPLKRSRQNDPICFHPTFPRFLLITMFRVTSPSESAAIQSVLRTALPPPRLRPSPSVTPLLDLS